MKTNYRSLILSIIVGSVLSISLPAQTARNPTNDMNELSRRSTAREVQQRDDSQRSSAAGQLSSMESNRTKRSRGVNVYKELKKQYERTSGTLVPPDHYYHQYKDYLKGDKHELARLQPEMNCLDGRIFSAKDAERCADVVPVNGNGSYYSFVSGFNYPTLIDIYGKKPSYMFKSDAEQPILGPRSSNKRDLSNNRWNIHFDKNRFEVARDGVQGIIADLGKRDLSAVTINSLELQFLADYQPGVTFELGEKQIESLAKGVTSNNFLYSVSAPVQMDHTYILRSIHYPYKSEIAVSGQKYYTSYGNDVTVAFQVVGKEIDGSLIILWKTLHKEKLTQKYKS